MEIIVNGERVSVEKFEEMKSNPNILLVEVGPGQFTTKQKLKG